MRERAAPRAAFAEVRGGPGHLDESGTSQIARSRPEYDAWGLPEPRGGRDSLWVGAGGGGCIPHVVCARVAEIDPGRNFLSRGLRIRSTGVACCCVASSLFCLFSFLFLTHHHVRTSNFYLFVCSLLWFSVIFYFF